MDLDPEAASPYNDRGFAYATKGEFDNAIADYNKVIELDPNDAMAYNNRGIAHSLKGELENAIADFDKAIELDPNYTDAYINRGATYADKGELDKAIADFDKAIELDPEKLEAYFSRAFTYLDLGEYQQAIENFKSVLPLATHDLLANIYGNLGWTYYLMAEYDLSIEASTTGIEIDPTQAWSQYNLGLTYLASGSYAQAEAEYARAIETTISENSIEVAMEDLAALIAANPEVEEAETILEMLEQAKTEFGH